MKKPYIHPKYRHLTEQQRWVEYGRLKREYNDRYGYTDEKQYDRFIDKIVNELGL